MNEQYLPICTHCYAVRVEPHRVVSALTGKRALRPTCMDCGEKLAKQRKHTIVPLHKSNYIVVTNPDDLMGINNKGGLHR